MSTDTITTPVQKMIHNIVLLESLNHTAEFIKEFIDIAALKKWHWTGKEINEFTVRVTIGGLVREALNILHRTTEEKGGSSCSTGRIVLTFHWDKHYTYAMLSCTL